MLCGSYCAKYVLEQMGIKNVRINPNMFWITEIALFLNKYISNKISIHYYNSKLMKDYYTKRYDDFDGFKYIAKILNTPEISFEEVELTKDELKRELNTSIFIILCVESRILNNDNSMEGGHFIILEYKGDNEIRIINPQKTNFIVSTKSFQEVVNMSNNYGSWRILIKEDKK